VVRRLKFIGMLRRLLEVVVFVSGDFLGVFIVIKLSIFLRLKVLPGVYSGFSGDVTVSDLNGYLIFAAWFFFLFYEGLYSRRFTFWDEAFAIIKACVFATLGVFVVGSLGRMSQEISRTVVVLAGITSLALLPSIRFTLKFILRKAGFFGRKVLVLGAGKTGRIIASALREESNYGYEIVGFLDDDDRKIGQDIEGVKVHRGVELADRYITRCGITDVFVAMPGADKDRVRRLVNRLQHRVDRLFVVPDIFGMAVTGTRLMHFFRAQTFAFEMKNNLAYPVNNLIKRLFDLGVCSVLIPLLLIPIGVISIFIRLGSSGPALFRQRRIGRRLRSFQCLKFRTMYEDADSRLEAILSGDSEARQEWETYRKLKDDPRVTAVGKVLRQTSLDELPQIFNVLVGQMSLVGPRPYLPREWEELTEYSETILSVRPGITGLWQVSGRSDTTFEVRLSLDAWYVRNWNLWLDVVILLKTLVVVLKKTGAR